MPLNRRRFILLTGLTLGASGVSAVACTKSTLQAQTPSPPSPSPLPTSTNLPTSPQLHSHIAPDGYFAPPRGNIRFIVISDLNSAYGSTDYRREVIEGVNALPGWQPDMVICGGDMVAGQSINLTATEIDAMWAAFDDKILTPIRTTGLPYALTIGNHDASGYKDENGEFFYVLDRQVTTKFWEGHKTDTNLTFIEASGFPYYYSFKQNDIFFLIWDASTANVPPEQIAWADRALATPEAQSAKLRIAMGHLPLYAVSQRRDRAGEYLNQADELRALLERHNVHTYISGHHHAYFPGKNGNLNMLHLGALGSGPKSLLNTTDAAFQTLTVMDIFLDTASTTYNTYNMSTRQVVDPQSLPRLIVGPNGRELRQDLAPQDLTPAEQSQPYVPSEA